MNTRKKKKGKELITSAERIIKDSVQKQKSYAFYKRRVTKLYKTVEKRAGSLL